ncbi:fumarylacetoacetate hydrolase family protein, partial [candidate division KSB1 bacterium]
KRNSGFRLGMLIDGYIFDLKKGWKILAENEGLDSKNNKHFTDMISFFNGGKEALTAAKKAGVFAGKLIKNNNLTSGVFIKSNQVVFGPPVLRPEKIICIGLNYRDHCKEGGVKAPKVPVIFSKFSTAVIGHNDYVVKPSQTKKLDYEAELAFVIGREGRWIQKKDWKKYVAGFTIMNDISARDIQFSDGQWIRGKSFDTFAPLGPYLVTTDEIKDPHNLHIQLSLNGETMQDSNTNNLIFDIPYLVSFLSSVVTLKPGDVISTGTPPGVGVFRDPPVLLKHNDEIEVTIEKIGTLKNRVVSESYYRKKRHNRLFK